MSKETRDSLPEIEEINQCRICDSPNLTPVLDLGKQPWCNDFVTAEEVGKEKRYPLEVYYCDDCTTVQLKHTLRREVMFLDHPYTSGTTQTMKRHFQQVTDKLAENFRFSEHPFVIDIGSNDGTLLHTFKRHNWRLLGIESCERIARFAIDDNVPTLNLFFDLPTARQIRQDYGTADIISAANVFYHVENLHEVTEGVKHLLSPRGIFVVQGSYLPSIVELRAFDVLYHEHLLLYRAETLDNLLQRHGLRIFDMEYYPEIHGGSFVAYITHQENQRLPETRNVGRNKSQEREGNYHKLERYLCFAEKVERLREQIRETVFDIKSKDGLIYATGAPAKGTVLLNYCGLTSQEIPFATELNPIKFGLYIPGTGILIVDENEVGMSPDYNLLLAWNFAKEIIQRNPNRKFIIPLPEVEIQPNHQLIELTPFYLDGAIQEFESKYPEEMQLLRAGGVYPGEYVQDLINPYTKEIDTDNYGSVGYHCLGTAMCAAIIASYFLPEGDPRIGKTISGALTHDVNKVLEIQRKKAYAKKDLADEAYSEKAYQTIGDVLKEKGLNHDVIEHVVEAGQYTTPAICLPRLVGVENGKLALMTDNLAGMIVLLADAMTNTPKSVMGKVTPCYFVTFEERIKLSELQTRYPYISQKGFGFTQEGEIVFFNDIKKISQENSDLIYTRTYLEWDLWVIKEICKFLISQKPSSEDIEDPQEFIKKLVNTRLTQEYNSP